MFWDDEKVIAVYETPEFVEGDPYIRKPIEADKSEKTKRKDRETGKYITLWDEKLRYPYKTKVSSTLTVVTTERTYEFKLKLADIDEITKEYCFIWNGQNIPKILWTLLGISKDSPIGLNASKWHDILLYKKEYYLEYIRLNYDADFSVGEYRRLTSLIYRQWLKNMGVNTIKANIMAGAVAGWQFVSPQWWGVD